MVCALPSMTKDESQIMSQESTLLTTHTGANLKSIKFHTVVNTLSIFSNMIGSNQHQLDNIIGHHKHSIPVLCNWTVCIMCSHCCHLFCQGDWNLFYENLWWITSLYLKFCHSFDCLVTRLHDIQFCLLSYL